MAGLDSTTLQRVQDGNDNAHIRASTLMSVEVGRTGWHHKVQRVRTGEVLCNIDHKSDGISILLFTRYAAARPSTRWQISTRMGQQPPGSRPGFSVKRHNGGAAPNVSQPEINLFMSRRRSPKTNFSNPDVVLGNIQQRREYKLVEVAKRLDFGVIKSATAGAYVNAIAMLGFRSHQECHCRWLTLN